MPPATGELQRAVSESIEQDNCSAANSTSSCHGVNAQSSSMYGTDYLSNQVPIARLAPRDKVSLPEQSGLESAIGFDVCITDSCASMHIIAGRTAIYECFPPCAENSTILIGDSTEYSVEFYDCLTSILNARMMVASPWFMWRSSPARISLCLRYMLCK